MVFAMTDVNHSVSTTSVVRRTTRVIVSNSCTVSILTTLQHQHMDHNDVWQLSYMKKHEKPN